MIIFKGYGTFSVLLNILQLNPLILMDLICSVKEAILCFMKTKILYRVHMKMYRKTKKYSKLNCQFLNS